MSDDLLKQIVDKLNGIEKRLDRHEEKLDAVYAQVANNSETLAAYTEQLISINEKLDTQDETIKILAARSIKHEAGINKALKKA